MWACIFFCLIPSLCFYTYFFYKFFRFSFNRIRTLLATHQPLLPENLQPVPESKTPTLDNKNDDSRRTRRWRPCGTSGSIPESIKIGSEFFTGVWPKFQVIIWAKNSEGVYIACSCAWRHGDYLVTSSHCLPEGSVIALSTDTGDVCELEYELLYSFDELAIIKIHPQFFTEFGITSARISADVDTMVRITGCDVKMASSVGMLRPTDIFATFKYSGSTRPGFSGAPYIIGDTRVVAMHICGGDIGNLCISATYIKTIVEKLKGEREPLPKKKRVNFVRAGKASFAVHPEPEAKGKQKRKAKHTAVSSKGNKSKNNDWYIEDIQEGTNVRVRKSRYDPDEYEVEINGRYYTMDADDVQDLKGRVARRRGHITYDGGPDYGRYDDGDPGSYYRESKNSNVNVLTESEEESSSEEDDFLDNSTKKSRNTVSSTSADSSLSPEHKVLMALMRQCFQESLILYESRKLKNSTLPSDAGTSMEPTK
nr:MAG: hypothetical protein 1 [Solemoviridae sp.]